MLLFGLLALFGCAGAVDGVEHFYDSKLTLDEPIDWWHQLQGGPIAAQRPPPPGITDPYRSLSEVPERPKPTSAVQRRALLAQLTSERDRARLIAAQDPIVFKGAAASSPPTKAANALVVEAPADPDASSVTLDAATTPTPPRATTSNANVDERPAPAPVPPTPSAIVVTSGPVPSMPTAAPALPVLTGLPISVAQPNSPRERPSVAFRFAPGSSTLEPSAEAALRTLVTRRAGGPIRVEAGGDARSSAPLQQRDALPLALRRTGAITAALIAAGVPPTAIRTEAIASGRDASARLVD